jgi:HAD superfamily hydrolase (TIGR01549 family)
MPKAVIFDIDGTLLDSVDQHAESWKLTFEHFGYRFPYTETRSQIGKGGDKLLAHFLTEPEIDSYGKQMEKYRGNLFQSTFLKDVKPFPYVRELFEQLRDTGHQVALATSAGREEVNRYEKILRIEDLVDAVTTKDDVANSKPDPDVLKIARGLLKGIPSSDCVFIGDTPYDVEAAVKDGMPAIAVLCGGFPEEDLRRAGTDSIYRDPEDLYKRWRLD